MKVQRMSDDCFTLRPVIFSRDPKHSLLNVSDSQTKILTLYLPLNWDYIHIVDTHRSSLKSVHIIIIKSWRIHLLETQNLPLDLPCLLYPPLSLTLRESKVPITLLELQAFLGAVAFLPPGDTYALPYKNFSCLIKASKYIIN